MHSYLSIYILKKHMQWYKNVHMSFQKNTSCRDIKWIDLDIKCKSAINNLIPVTCVAEKDKKNRAGNYQIRDAFAILGND